MKKFVSILLVVLILVSAVPVMPTASAVVAIDILSQIPYYGDRTKCRMTAEQALAYAEAIRTASFTSNNIYPVLWDISGDGVPLLLVVEEDYGYPHGSFELYGYESGKAVDIGITDITIVSVKGEKALLSTSYLDSGTQIGSRHRWFKIQNGSSSLMRELNFLVLSDSMMFDYDTLIPYFYTDDYSVEYYISDKEVSESEYLLAVSGISDWLSGSEMLVGYGNDGEIYLSDSISKYFTNSFTRSQATQIFQAYADALSTPTYTYPQPTLTEAQVRAMAEALAGKLDGELTQFYKLADDLYYVLVTLNGQFVGGAVLREGRQNGNPVYYVEYSDAEPLPEDKLTPYISKAASTPNVEIDFNTLSTFKTPSEFSEYLDGALKNTDGSAPNDAAKRNIAAYMQSAVSAQATSVLPSNNNQILITGADVAQSVNNARSTYDALTDALTQNKVTLDKPVTIIIRIEGQNLDWNRPMQVTFDKSLADTLGDNTVMLMLGDNRHSVSIEGANLRALADQYGSVTVQIERKSDGVYSIVFIDENGGIIGKLPYPVSVALPAGGAHDTVFASMSDGLENWGGQYDETVGTILFSTSFSGTYEVMENRFDISDIADFPDEMRDAIQFMVSKGLFQLQNGKFNPTGKLTRYDFASTLVKMFFALDKSLKTSFTDVPTGSGYYPYIASGEYAGIIDGIGEGLFAGDLVMKRQEAVMAAAHTLSNKKGYSLPGDPENYLSVFYDGKEIAGWARSPVALATREGLISRGGSFFPTRDITRAEAATILYRLFMLLYETPPITVEMQPLAATEPEPQVNVEAEPEAIPDEPDEEEPSFPVLPVVLGVLGALAAAGVGLYLAKKKKRKDDDAPSANDV